MKKPTAEVEATEKISYDSVWRKRYDNRALTATDEYQSLFHYDHLQQVAHQKLAFSLASKYGPRGKCLLIDVGCGTGTYIRRLFRQNPGDEAYGLDVSFNLMIRGRKDHPLLNGKFIQGGIEALPIKDKHFDIVLSMGVLQTVGNHKNALKELCRTVKPGGLLILSTLRRHVLWELFLLPWILFKYYFDQDKIAGETLNMIRNRENLVWRELPNDLPPHKYSFGEIKKQLSGCGMSDIKCFFPGRVKKIPVLLNSFHMFIVARRPGQGGSLSTVMNNNPPVPKVLG